MVYLYLTNIAIFIAHVNFYASMGPPDITYYSRQEMNLDTEVSHHNLSRWWHNEAI